MFDHMLNRAKLLQKNIEELLYFYLIPILFLGHACYRLPGRRVSDEKALCLMMLSVSV
jgi:hypothetical protein